MKRLNVTLAVEEDLQREARAMTARRRTAWERIQPLLDRPTVQLGGSRSTRDELHER
jgi:hypothetical protein